MKKSLIMLLCVVLTISSAAFGTIAYLTDRDSIENTFTVGNVDIKVDETVVDTEGQPEDEDEDGTPDRTEEGEGNEYHLIPGKDYVKDPTMTVMGSSEECYARMLVTVTHAEELAAICADMTAKDPAAYPNGLPQDHVSGFDPAIWVYEKTVTDTENNTATYYFRHYAPVDPQGVDTVLPAIFTEIKVPGLVTGEQLATIADFKITVEGQAIQTAAFETEDEAWAAFDKQMTPAAGEDDTEGGENEGTEGDGTEPNPDVDEGGSED